uniref:Uncharacterized protein n=1 Tax=Panagrolaimus sp. ES5 TaxID=591445 RepID=A0AC34GQS9_9BILA
MKAIFVLLFVLILLKRFYALNLSNYFELESINDLPDDLKDTVIFTNNNTWKIICNKDSTQKIEGAFIFTKEVQSNNVGNFFEIKWEILEENLIHARNASIAEDINNFVLIKMATKNGLNETETIKYQARKSNNGQLQSNLFFNADEIDTENGDDAILRTLKINENGTIETPNKAITIFSNPIPWKNGKSLIPFEITWKNLESNIAIILNNGTLALLNETFSMPNYTKNSNGTSFTTSPPKIMDIFVPMEDMYTSNIIGLSFWAWFLLTSFVTILTILLSICIWNYGSKRVIGFVLREKEKITIIS